MSGSGSGGGFGSGGSGGVVDCAEFSFETHIHSPDPQDVGQLAVGMVLSVVLDELDGIQVVQVRNGNSVVGGLVENGPKIRKCLSAGYSFSAIVRGISGAAVRIFVLPANKVR